MLRIEHITKRYGEKCAVDDLSLHIAPGEIYGFIGHNGAGKTTTLKAAVGLLTPDEGEIFVCGHSVKKEPLVCKQCLSYIPDNPDLYEFLTGHQYFSFVADVYKVPADIRKNRIDHYSQMLGITDALAKPISTYSHGMKQKTAIIAALLHDPKLIMMDEPFVGLDPLASHQLKTLMAEHCKNGGAIFFSTHVMEVAEKLCHKVAVIRNGKLIAAGSMDTVRGDSSLEKVFLELSEQEGAE